MGVDSFWPIVSSKGKLVSLDILADKILAIDASIWIYQFANAMKDASGEQPVFVFDGPAHPLKFECLRKRHDDSISDAAIRKAAQQLLLQNLNQLRVKTSGNPESRPGFSPESRSRAPPPSTPSSPDEVHVLTDSDDDSSMADGLSPTRRLRLTVPDEFRGFMSSRRTLDCVALPVSPEKQREIESREDDKYVSFSGGGRGAMDVFDHSLDFAIDEQTLASLPLQEQYRGLLQARSAMLSHGRRKALHTASAMGKVTSAAQDLHALSSQQIQAVVELAKVTDFAKTVRLKLYADDQKREVYVPPEDLVKEKARGGSFASQREKRKTTLKQWYLEGHSNEHSVLTSARTAKREELLFGLKEDVVKVEQDIQSSDDSLEDPSKDDLLLNLFGSGWNDLAVSSGEGVKSAEPLKNESEDELIVNSQDSSQDGGVVVLKEPAELEKPIGGTSKRELADIGLIEKGLSDKGRIDQEMTDRGATEVPTYSRETHKPSGHSLSRQSVPSASVRELRQEEVKGVFPENPLPQVTEYVLPQTGAAEPIHDVKEIIPDLEQSPITAAVSAIFENPSEEPIKAVVSEPAIQTSPGRPIEQVLQDTIAKEISSITRGTSRDIPSSDLLLDPLLDSFLNSFISDLEGVIDSTGLSNREKILTSDVGSTYEEIQQLLVAFGVPWVSAPADAEAQCAFLCARGLVDGVISDDSDTLIFGSPVVFRHLYMDASTVEMFKAEKLGFDREQLISLALLLGCDYTEGVRGVGPVNATEIVKHYQGMEGLREFRRWADELVREEAPANTDDSPLLIEFKRSHANYRNHWVFPQNFPSQEIWDLFQSPPVDLDEEPFSWDTPDEQEVVDVVASYCDLPPQQLQATLANAVEKYKQARIQRRITDYFSPAFDRGVVAEVVSKRLRAALN